MKTLLTPCALCIMLFISWVGKSQVIGPNFMSDFSTRNSQLKHYYRMVAWDDSQYKEGTYFNRSSAGTITEFMNWRIIFPAGYQQSGSTKYPIIVMLHGAGESGREWTGNFTYTPADPEFDSNGNNLMWGGEEHRNAVNRPASDNRSFPGIVVFPQVSYNGAWSGAWDAGALSNNNRMAATVIEHLVKNFNADPYRIVIHGLSSGAKGVWDIAAKRPDLFAGMLPMSGVGTDMRAMTDTLVTMPIWLFQGGQDTNPSPGYAQQWIDELKRKGGNPRFTVYPNLGHGVWNTAYAENDFFSWIKSVNKRKIYVFGGATSLDVNPTIKLGFSAGYSNYQWTKDGVDITGEVGRYYTATEPGAYAVKFTRRIDGVNDISMATQITATPGAQNGLTYKYYQYAWSIFYLSLFNFSQTPVATGKSDNFTNSVRRRDNRYVISFDGNIQIDNAGVYRFYTNSDDGSQLFINGSLVVNNDGRHSATIASGLFTFSSPGKYPIRVTYFQHKGSQTLHVRYSEGTTDNYFIASPIPNSKLFLPTQQTTGAYRVVSTLPTEQTNEAVPRHFDSGQSEDMLRIVLGVSPNPFKHEVRVLYSSDPVGPYKVSVHDMMSGQPVKNMQVVPNGNEIILDLSDVPSGRYVLTVGGAKFRLVKLNQ